MRRGKREGKIKGAAHGRAFFGLHIGFCVGQRSNAWVKCGPRLIFRSVLPLRLARPCRERRSRHDDMARDDDFEPRLGRIRTQSGRVERRYLQNVLKGIARAGGRAAKGRQGFSGKHHGKGTGAARILTRGSGLHARRVIVKSRIVPLRGKLDGARAHLRYIQRDGVTRDGAPGELYDAARDLADGKAFLDRADGDRHQFRFIVSADDGAQYDDLKGVTRRLMQQMEADLGTKLEWVAVDHFNTGHPHSHVIVRGTTERGDDLVIARDYLIQGLRERACELVTLDLGPRTDIEIQTAIRAEVSQERLTGLDRTLIEYTDADGVVSVADIAANSFRRSLLAGRLQKLRALGLAEEGQSGRWRLDTKLEARLRDLGERHDIIKTMHRELTRLRRASQGPDIAIFDPAAVQSVVGRVAARGLSDELHDRHYLIVDGIDGRSHYVDIGTTSDPYPADSIVAIRPRQGDIRAVDRTVAEIAAKNNGRYSIDIHLRHDTNATQAFAEAHVRRLEAMRRLDNLVGREPDGTWIVAPDHLVRAQRYEQSQLRRSPVAIETLSVANLGKQLGSDGATWLDRELVTATPAPLREAGFGKEARAALIARQQWLVEQGLAERDHDQIVYRANLLRTLRSRDLARAGTQLSAELGLAFTETKPGARVEGVYQQCVDLVSGRFAVVTRARDFTLVPWREVLDRSLGKSVSGIVREEGISWSIGQQRKGPEIS
jgi:type IV secretory pathway VirD2 relaxase